ncbi:hypothetical protein E2C01_055060 [Portunus trituberculatus]|uniref:Uncharacterized protein n=1 Tax=Portunus trituberculatus TaxID=210409 RepID=A0A5B7GVK5_PORTR|nr:hypothetical protein [Portunus trituberculatus]
MVRGESMQMTRRAARHSIWLKQYNNEGLVLKRRLRTTGSKLRGYCRCFMTSGIPGLVMGQPNGRAYIVWLATSAGLVVAGANATAFNFVNIHRVSWSLAANVYLFRTCSGRRSNAAGNVCKATPRPQRGLAAPIPKHLAATITMHQKRM